MDEQKITNQIINLSEWSPNPKNYNTHGDEQVRRIAISLSTFGQPESVTVWRKPHGKGKDKKKGYFIAGHGVRLAALRLEWQELRADVLPASYDETRAEAYIVAANRLAEFSDPDDAALMLLLDQTFEAGPRILEATGYSEDEYEKLARAAIKEAEVFSPNLNELISGVDLNGLGSGAQGPNTEADENGDGSNDPDFTTVTVPPPSTTIRQLQLFYDGDTHARFIEMEQLVRDSTGAPSLADCVYDLVEKAFDESGLKIAETVAV